jgi:hypothetical protein
MKPATLESLAAISKEVARAREKHPGNAHLLAALVEEVGELAKDLLEGNPGWRAEAIQVATVAVRILEEGDGDFHQHTGEKCSKP